MMNIMEDDLRRGLAAGEIVPFMQPLVELRSGRVAGFEVLARWRHPTYGLLQPGSFIPLAESTDLIWPLTEQMVSQSCSAAAGWPDDLLLSINVAPVQFKDRRLAYRLAALAEAEKFPINRFMIEITETGIIANYEQTRSACEDLKRMGGQIALDDFGTGHSSLKHVHELPLDKIKIDASFVQSILERRESRKIVASIVGLGRSLGLATIAEGVERPAQADMLGPLGCDMGQGWLFGKPVPLDEAQGYIRAPAWNVALRSPRQDSPADVSLSLETISMQRMKLLEAIYYGAGVGLCFIDRDRRYLTLNKKLADFDNLPVAAHLGRTVAEVLPNCSPELDGYITRALAGEEGIEYELTRSPRPGVIEVYLVSIQPVRDEAEEVVGVSGAVIDISERARMQRELRDSEAHYRDLIELSPHIHWTADADGKLIAISSAWETLTGIKPEPGLMRSWSEGAHPDERAKAAAAWEFAKSTRTAMDIEIQMPLAQGGQRWMRSRAVPRFRDDGTVARWYGLIEDVHDRTISEATLRSRLTTDKILEIANDVIIVTDANLEPPGPVIVFVNGAFSHLTGYSAQEAIGVSPRLLQGPGTSRETLDLIRADLEAGRTSRHTILNYAKSGTPFWFEMRIEALRDDKGAITHFVAFERDVTQDSKRLDDAMPRTDCDPVTGACNRALLRRLTVAEMENVCGGPAPCIAVIRIDDLAALAIRFGHGVIENLRFAVAARLGQNIRRVDFMGQLDPEIFAICMPRVSLTDAAGMAGRLCRCIADAPFEAIPAPVQISASFGVSQAGPGERDFEALVDRAKHALDRAMPDRGSVPMDDAPLAH